MSIDWNKIRYTTSILFSSWCIIWQDYNFHPDPEKIVGKGNTRKRRWRWRRRSSHSYIVASTSATTNICACAMGKKRFRVGFGFISRKYFHTNEMQQHSFRLYTAGSGTRSMDVIGGANWASGTTKCVWIQLHVGTI